MHFFSKIDIFKQPVPLHIDKSDNLSTHFGKLITFFLIFYTMFTLFRSDLVLHRNPTVKSENIRPLMRPPIHFNYSNFIFAFGIYDLNLGYIVDPTVATFSAGIVLINNLDNTYIHTPLEMKLCEEADLINAGKNLNSTDSHNLFCFHIKNETIDLYGSVNEKEIQFLYLELNRCKNTSEKNFTCKSFEDQENFLQVKFQDIIFQNDALEYSDYFNPIEKDVIKHYVTLETSFLKIIKTYIKHLSFLSDDGFFFESSNRQDSYTVDNLIYDFQSNNFEKDLPFVRIEMYVDNNETKNSRRYQHIQDLLAEMGGVLNIFILMGLLLINIEIPYIITKKISSQLYSYNIDNHEIVKDEIVEENEENKRLSNLSSFNLKYPKEAAKSSTQIDFSSTDVKMSAKKLVIFKNEPFSSTNKLSISKDFQWKENDASPKTMRNLNFISSNKSRANLNFTAKIPTLKGDEDTLDERNSEIESPNENIRMQRRCAVSIPNNTNIRKTNSIRRNMKTKGSIIQAALKFSIDLKNKLSLKRLLEHNIKRGKENFPISFWSYLSILFKCKRFNLSQREKLFLLGEEQIKKDLDIFKIINCMNDIEKLKMILLNDKQRLLFNLLQKPIITTKPINQEFERNSLIVDGIKKNVTRSIAENFYKDLIANSERSDIDKRILLLADKNLVSLDAIHLQSR